MATNAGADSGSAACSPPGPSSPDSGAAVGPSSPDPGAAVGPSSAASAASSVIDFLVVAGGLKRTPRQGWVYQGVKDVESVADHSHRMALMALVSAGVPGVDQNKCVKMAIVHDIAEAIVGDITPSDGVPKEEKQRRESAAIDDMCRVLGPLGNEVRELWQEYEECATEEAKLVKDFDKVEMILQAVEYEQAQGKNLEEFFTSTQGKFLTETGRAYAEAVREKRRKAQRGTQRQ